MNGRSVNTFLAGLSFACALGSIANAQTAVVEGAQAPSPASGALVERPYLGGRVFDSSSSEANFRALDRDERGYLTQSETSRVSEFDFTAADVNGDGQITFSEFDRSWRSSFNRGVRTP